ncbi:MAG: hypothetical protein MUO63_13665 [Desulfobulbaceae bacterium]|nr:hypothetical protein [Desulfobulbaceae bacterium]
MAITHDLAEYLLPFNKMACSSTKRGEPNSTFAPSLQKRSTDSCCWMVAMTDLILSRTRAKSTGGAVISGSP